MSPQTQNEIAGIGQHIVLRDVVQEIKQGRYYSIMVGEVASHNTEQLAYYVRYVDACSNIRQESLSFVKVERRTGETIARAIVGLLKDLGIPVENMRGQGYDGDRNMSSGRVGVQAGTH